MEGAICSELSAVEREERLDCDVLIIGGGPAGLTVARGVSGEGRKVLVLESGGLTESPESEELNAVVGDPGDWSEEQARRRRTFHAPQARHWSHERQSFGVRCRALGGSTAAWAGKSAAFDPIDFAARPWVPHSGWPVSPADVEAHLVRAAEALNLGTICNGDGLWEVMRRQPPEPRPHPARLGSFFWQFARSTVDPMDIMRFGAEFLKNPPSGCRILTGATVLEILTDETGFRARGVVTADGAGNRHEIKAKFVVLAASAIENARLLLNSRRSHPGGLGNRHDTVGRYLMDHPGAVVAEFEPDAIQRMVRLFGFYGIKGPRGAHMYMRGLAPTPATQEAEELLNCAAYMPGERAPDDPWEAARRLLKGGSDDRISDALAILRAPRLVAVGAGRLAFQSRRIPEWLRHAAIDTILRLRPGLAVEEYLTGGVPHKLVALQIHAVCEQVPDPENRVTLSRERDRFGQHLPAVRWRLGEAETRTLMRLAELIQAEFAAAGLPQPVLADWVTRGDGAASAIIDMAHSSGTTRMSANPRQGVVDADCRVHGVAGLFVAGASVFPTSGHANPTLMIVAFADRLAAHLRRELARDSERKISPSSVTCETNIHRDPCGSSILASVLRASTG